MDRGTSLIMPIIYLYSARRTLPSIIFPIAIPQYPGADFFPGNTDPEDMKS
jgi:hypothetical protein